MKIRVSLGTTLAQAVLSELASGSGGTAKLEIYSGLMPSSIGAMIADTLLASFLLDSAVGSELNGVITLSGWTDDPSAPASGVPGWARIVNKSGDEVMLLSAGATGSGKSVMVSPDTIAAGEPVNLTSGVIRMPV